MEQTYEKEGQAVEDSSREEEIKLTLEDCFAQRRELRNKKTEIDPDYVTAEDCSAEKKGSKGLYSAVKKIARTVAFYGLFVGAGMIAGYTGKSNEPEIKQQMNVLEQKVADFSTRVGNAASELSKENKAVEADEHSQAYNKLMQNLAQSIQGFEEQMSPEEFESFCTDVYAVFEKYDSGSADSTTKLDGGNENGRK